MASGRSYYFTLMDEAAFTEGILDKFPHAIFAEAVMLGSAEIRQFESIQSADCSSLHVIIPNRRWVPTFETHGTTNWHHVTNLPELSMSIHRSSNGWAPTELTKDGKPRWITEGSCSVFYSRPVTKAQRSFRDKIWRLFPSFATWELKYFHRETRRPLETAKTDKIVWAGNDAVRWARENPLRRFIGPTIHYRPVD